MRDTWNWLTSFIETERLIRPKRVDDVKRSFIKRVFRQPSHTKTETVDDIKKRKTFYAQLSRIETFFLQLSHTACYQQLQPQFKEAFNAAHTRCLFQRDEGCKHSGIPKQHRQWYDSAGSLFESLWNAPEIRNYFSAFEQAGYFAYSSIGPERCFKPPPDDYSLLDEYWFPSGRADELRPLRDAVHEFLKTIGVVQEYHLLLGAIIEDFLRKDPCQARPELDEDSADLARVNTIYNALGQPTDYMADYLHDVLIEARNFPYRREHGEEARQFRSQQELATNDPIVRRFLALFDVQPTSTNRLIRGGHPYILSELNRQLETLRNVLNEDDADYSAGKMEFFGRNSVADNMSLEFGSLEDWTKAQATSRCPITARRWEPDTIVPAALKLISFTNPDYGSESVMLYAGTRKVLGQAAKTILSWTFAQYNLMFLQGLLAAFAEMRKPSFESVSGTPATDTVKTELQKIAQVCYHSHYNKTRTPDARGMLLEGIASEIFTVYAINRLAKPFSDGRTCHRHKEFDAAEKHYREAIAAAKHILKFCQHATLARWPEAANRRTSGAHFDRQLIFHPDLGHYRKLFQAQWVQEARRIAAAMAAAASYAIASIDLEQRKNLGEAAERARHALEAWPQADKPQILGTLIYRRKGEVAEALGHFEEAIADYQTAKDLAPDNAQLLCELALLYTRVGKFDEALAEFQTALALAPDNARGLQALAYIYAMREQNLEEAVMFAQRALELSGPETPPPQIACTRQVLGWLYLQQGEVEKALEELENRELYEECPSPLLYRVLGDAYKATEQHQDAKTAWQVGWDYANSPNWQEYVKNVFTPFEADQEKAYRTELRERLGIQENTK